VSAPAGKQGGTAGKIIAVVIVGVIAVTFWCLVGAFVASTSYGWLDVAWFGVPVLFFGTAAVSGVRRARRRRS
jgi:steroid 5-alpha reductase family enzyme